MIKVFCNIADALVDSLFEVFDGGDFILSSYHDIEEPDTQMQVYLSDPAQADEAARRLKDALALVGSNAQVGASEVPDEDWKLSYRRHFKIEPIGRRLVTVPTWELEGFKESSEFSDRIPLVLDPGMAFGTGKHETTRACLEYIDELAGNGAQSFLDMGCGSGILSIAAAKLGFSPVAGFDIDEDAVNASRENAALNGVSVDYRLFALGGSVAAPFAPADFVVANILGPLLIAFADEIAGYAKKTLIVSGILNELYPEVRGAFAALGFSEVSRKTIGEWTTGCLCRA